MHGPGRGRARIWIVPELGNLPVRMDMPVSIAGWEGTLSARLKGEGEVIGTGITD
jgi:hypothetical protein